MEQDMTTIPAYQDGYADGKLLNTLIFSHQLKEPHVLQVTQVMQTYYQQTHPDASLPAYVQGLQAGMAFRLSEEEAWADIFSEDDALLSAEEQANYNINTHFSFYHDGQQTLEKVIKKVLHTTLPGRSI